MVFAQVQDISFDRSKQLRHAAHDRVGESYSRLELGSFDAVQHQDPGQAPEFPRHLDRLGNAECVAGVMEEPFGHGHACRVDPVHVSVCLAGAYRIDNQHVMIPFPRLHEPGAFPALLDNPDTREMPAKDLPGGENSQTVVRAVLVPDADEQYGPTLCPFDLHKMCGAGDARIVVPHRLFHPPRQLFPVHVDIRGDELAQVGFDRGQILGRGGTILASVISPSSSSR